MRTLDQNLARKAIPKEHAAAVDFHGRVVEVTTLAGDTLVWSHRGSPERLSRNLLRPVERSGRVGVGIGGGLPDYFGGAAGRCNE
jgi:hypothetical protein